jgi:hypothetical protein
MLVTYRPVYAHLLSLCPGMHVSVCLRTLTQSCHDITFTYKPNMKNWRTLASFFLILKSTSYIKSCSQQSECRHSIAVICGITEWRANQQTVDTCVFIVRESDFKSGRSSGGYNTNSKKHLFLYLLFCTYSTFEIVNIRKQWWTEICASQSSGGRQY